MCSLKPVYSMLLTYKFKMQRAQLPLPHPCPLNDVPVLVHHMRFNVITTDKTF